MSLKGHLVSHDLEIDKEGIDESFVRHLAYTLGADEYSATPRDFFASLAYAVRDRMLDRWRRTQQRYHARDVRRVYYLSLEYLIGRVLSNSLLNLGLHETSRQELHELGIELGELETIEVDPGLGNGVRADRVGTQPPSRWWLRSNRDLLERRDGGFGGGLDRMRPLLARRPDPLSPDRR